MGHAVHWEGPRRFAGELVAFTKLSRRSEVLSQSADSGEERRKLRHHKQPRKQGLSATPRADAGTEPASAWLASSLGERVLFRASLGTLKKTKENKGHSQITVRLSL